MPPSHTLLQSRIEQGVLVLTITEPHLRGDTLVEALHQELFGVVSQTNLARVILDMKQVTSVASEAFRPLLTLRRTLGEAGGRLVLCNLSPVVSQTFRTTRLLDTGRTSTFEVQPSVEEAVANLSRATSAS